MLFLRDKGNKEVEEVDFTARAILNLGRTTGSIKPNVIHLRNANETTILDTDFLERFVYFCASLEEQGMTEYEMLLFRAQSSTEVSIEISETERESVFNELSAEILAIVYYEETKTKIITEEWRLDSEINRERTE